MPQLPTTTVVTPWLILGSMCGADEHDLVVVRVHVDESRRDDHAARVDHVGAVGGQIRADRDDALALDAHVGAKRAAPVPSMTVPPRSSKRG